MISIRPAHERGLSKMDWLNSFHTFSFADYYDLNYMGFGNLRVINEDTVQPGMGFGTHSHRDMEIISYVVSGAMEHKDSMGTGSVIRPGEIQRMSAGTGVSHSEFNHSNTEPLHFLQIWIIPEKTGLTPSYEQKTIPRNIYNQFILIASKNKKENAVKIHQDADLYVAYLEKGASISYMLNIDRIGWLQLIKGKISLNEFELAEGDGAALSDEKELSVFCNEDAELLFFDLKK